MPLKLTPNPLTVREARERWRRPWMIGWLGIYAAILAVCGVFLYQQTVPNEILEARNASGVGRAIFQAFARVQLVFWIATGIFLGAPMLAVERQRRSLLDFFLAGLTPQQILAAKWRSVAAFALVVMLCPLPVLALCFVLGGVSPWEFAAFVALLLSTGLSSCALGLLVSVECRDVSTALSNATLCAACFVTVGAPLVVAFLEAPPFWSVAGVLVGGVVAAALLDITRAKLAEICARLGEETQTPHRFEAKISFEDDQIGASTTYVRATRDEFERGEVVLPTLVSGGFAPPPTSARVKIEIAGRHDIELSRWENQLERLAAPNPVARRMWRAYLGTTARFDEPGIGMHPARGAVLGGVPLLLWSLANAMTPVWGIAALGAAAVLSGLVIAQMAPSFVREREGATLEPLVLSALSPREIVGGKLLGVALITARLGLWPVVALAIWGLASGLALWSAVLALLAAQLGFAGGVAAWASLRFRQASVAAGVSWGAILFAWVVAWWSAHRVALPVASAIALWAGILALGGAFALWSAVGQLKRSFSRR